MPTADSHLIFVADHCCDPAEPFKEGEAFKKKCVYHFEQMERRFIKDWDTEATSARTARPPRRDETHDAPTSQMQHRRSQYR